MRDCTRVRGRVGKGTHFVFRCNRTLRGLRGPRVSGGMLGRTLGIDNSPVVLGVVKGGRRRVGRCSDTRC